MGLRWFWDSGVALLGSSGSASQEVAVRGSQRCRHLQSPAWGWQIDLPGGSLIGLAGWCWLLSELPLCGATWAPSETGGQLPPGKGLQDAKGKKAATPFLTQPWKSHIVASTKFHWSCRVSFDSLVEGTICMLRGKDHPGHLEALSLFSLHDTHKLPLLCRILAVVNCDMFVVSFLVAGPCYTASGRTKCVALVPL